MHATLSNYIHTLRTKTLRTLYARWREHRAHVREGGDFLTTAGWERERIQLLGAITFAADVGLLTEKEKSEWSDHVFYDDLSLGLMRSLEHCGIVL